MTIGSLIREAFPEGLEYDDAAQLCLMLYSVVVLPDEMMQQCTKQNLPVVFAELATTGVIRVEKARYISIRYGANFHDPRDKGHWVEVIASIFKIGDTCDLDRGKRLAARLADRLQAASALPPPLDGV